MLTIRTAILLAVSAIVAVQGYEKTPMGTTCAKRVLEIKKEKECIQACAELGYQYLGSWDTAGDFPACTFTEGLNKVCHFNTNKNPGRTDVNTKYSAICKECKDKKPEKTCQNAGILKNKCQNTKWARRNCMATCAICDPNAIIDDGKKFEKSAQGSLCNPQNNELATEGDCITACAELGIQYSGSWDGPNDFPKCVYTEGLNKVCHFNTSPNPGRTDINPKYTAICKKP